MKRHNSSHLNGYQSIFGYVLTQFLSNLKHNCKNTIVKQTLFYSSDLQMLLSTLCSQYKDTCIKRLISKFSKTSRMSLGVCCSLIIVCFSQLMLINLSCEIHLASKHKQRSEGGLRDSGIWNQIRVTSWNSEVIQSQTPSQKWFILDRLDPFVSYSRINVWQSALWWASFLRDVRRWLERPRRLWSSRSDETTSKSGTFFFWKSKHWHVRVVWPIFAAAVGTAMSWLQSERPSQRMLGWLSRTLCVNPVCSQFEQQVFCFAETLNKQKVMKWRGFLWDVQAEWIIRNALRLAESHVREVKSIMEM